MVIVEVIVRDAADNPVRDLTAKDLRVSETIGDSKELPQKIASLRLVTEPVGERKDNSKGIVLGWLHKSFCALTGAYELSYYLSPDSRKDGLHRISVTSARDGLTRIFVLATESKRTSLRKCVPENWPTRKPMRKQKSSRHWKLSARSIQNSNWR
jgi:hypothetical protein